MISVVQGDYGHRVVFVLYEVSETPGLCPPREGIDLTQIDVRGLFYQYRVRTENACGAVSFGPPDNAIFHRILEKLETSILDLVAVAGGPSELAPDGQPTFAQRLTLVITAFSVSGTVVITGTDADGVAITETVTITAAGTYYTTLSFLTISSETITITGTFSTRIYVHDGRVRLTWQDGDLDTSGAHRILLELLPSGGLITSLKPIEVQVAAKQRSSLPVISTVTPSEFVIPDTIVTVVGTSFLDATKILVTNVQTGSSYELEDFLYVDDTTVKGTVTASIPTGLYVLTVVGPGGTSVGYYPVDIDTDIPTITFVDSLDAPGAVEYAISTRLIVTGTNFVQSVDILTDEEADDRDQVSKAISVVIIDDADNEYPCGVLVDEDEDLELTATSLVISIPAGVPSGDHVLVVRTYIGESNEYALEYINAGIS